MSENKQKEQAAAVQTSISIESLQADNAALKNQLAEQDEIIKDLQAKLEAAASTAEKAAGSIVITHNKEQYKVLVSSFKFKGKEYKAEVLKTDKALVKTLVEASAGFLVKL